MAKRTTTVTHPDGSTSTRTSATRTYEWAVQVREDLHAKAAQLLAMADQRQADVDRIRSIVDCGDLAQLARITTSRNGRGDRFRSSFLPGHTPDTAWYWLPDHQNAASWAQHIAGALARIADVPPSLRAYAQELLEGPAVAYGVVRWSTRRDSADSAAPGFVQHSYQSVEVVPTTVV